MDNIHLAELTGQTEQHLTPLPATDVLVHKEMLAPLQELLERASQAGIAIQVASAFRSFNHQLAIWNAKVKGERPVLDSYSKPVDLTRLSDKEKVWAILRWSALPGTSRHHWGTDIDIWDSNPVNNDYRLQLVPEEYQPGGPFVQLSTWLETNLTEQQDFVRPYSQDKGGVAPEPWHLSYNPVAQRYQQDLNPTNLTNMIETSDILLKQAVLDNLEEIFAQFILC